MGRALGNEAAWRRAGQTLGWGCGHCPPVPSWQVSVHCWWESWHLSLILLSSSSILIVFGFSANSSDSENRLTQINYWLGLLFICFVNVLSFSTVNVSSLEFQWL